MHRHISEAFRGACRKLIAPIFATAPQDELAEARSASFDRWNSTAPDERVRVQNILAEIVEIAADPDESVPMVERCALLNARVLDISSSVLGIPMSAVAARGMHQAERAEAEAFITGLFGDDSPNVIIVGL